MRSQLLSNCPAFLSEASGGQRCFTKPEKLRGPGKLAHGNRRFAHLVFFTDKQKQ
jgi:hypothetical protein